MDKYKTFRVLEEVLHSGHLDRPSTAALAATCNYCAYAVQESHLYNSQALIDQNQLATAITPPFTSAAVAPVTPAANGGANNNDSSSDDQLTPSTSGVTTPKEMPYIASVITPEAQIRILAIPVYAPDASLPGLPTELQQQIFSYLDKIDSVCLGLTSRHAQAMYKAIHGVGQMKLNTRRLGPNTEESCWEIVGVTTCGHCGTDRCELWRHIKDWVTRDNNLEYCAMKHVFGSPAKSGAHPTCYRNKPSKPRRCGRHPDRTITIHESDTSRASRDGSSEDMPQTTAEDWTMV